MSVLKNSIGYCFANICFFQYFYLSFLTLIPNQNSITLVCEKRKTLIRVNPKSVHNVWNTVILCHVVRSELRCKWELIIIFQCTRALYVPH